MSDRGTITLNEYGSCSIALTDAELASLRAVAGRALSFGAGERSGEVELKAGSHVGTIVTPTLSVLIRPKVPLANLFHLLESSGVPLALAEETFGYDESRDLLPALVGLFATQVEQATRRGLYQSYRQHDEPLVALRGRIDLAAQIRLAGQISPVACRFDEFTADVEENRVLKCALGRVARLAGVPDQTRRRIARLLLAFDEVADEEMTYEVVDRIVWTRLNRHYEPALRLAQLVLRWTSLVDRAGRRQANAFLVDMNTVFEEFLEHRLRHELRSRLQVLGQDPMHLDVEQRVRVRPDLVFRRDDEPVYVADAKYKISNDGLARESDYYQLLAYCTSLRLPEGMLVYCDAEGERPPSTVTVRGTGVRLVTHRVPLGGSRRDIDEAVARLADDIANRAFVGDRLGAGRVLAPG